MLDLESKQGGAVDEQALDDAREVLQHLDKALRVYRLYDPGNEMVTRFMTSLREKLMLFLRDFGELAVRVRPTAFEMRGHTLDGGGLDELALALFRQGIVTLALNSRMDEAQLRKLVGLLSHGLLWRADLTGVKYTSILGYTEDGGEEELNIDADAVDATLSDALQADLGSVPEKASAELEKKADLLSSEGGDLPPELKQLVDSMEVESTIRLQQQLLEVLREAFSSEVMSELFEPEEVRRMLSSLVGALLAQRDIEGLAATAAELRTMVAASSAEGATPLPHHEVLESFVEAGLDETAVHELLETLPGEIMTHAEEITTVLSVFAQNQVAMVADLADRQSSDQGRNLLSRILVSLAKGDPDFLVTRFRSLEGRQAVEALAVLVQLDIKLARKAVSVRLPAAPSETQVALLEAVHTIPGLYDERVRAALLRLGARGGRLRELILASFEQYADYEVASEIWSWVRGNDFDEWEPSSVEVALRALLKLSEAEALSFCEEALRRKSLFRRRALVDLKIAVVTALGSSDSPIAGALLHELEDSRDKSLHYACRDALEQRSARQAQGALAGKGVVR